MGTVRVDRLEPRSLATYKGSRRLRVFLGGIPKMGKTTCALTALRGRAGRLLDSPKHLHILSCDPGAPRVIQEYRDQWPELDEVSVYDFESDCSAVRTLAPNESPLFSRLCEQLDYLSMKSAAGELGNSMLWISGAGVMAEGIQREVRLSIDKAPIDSMDKHRWVRYGNRIDIIRSKAHALDMHVVWEFQVMEWIDDDKKGETALLQGRQAVLFASLCEQALKLEQRAGTPTKPGPRVFNTRPNWPFMKASRLAEHFDPEEPADLSVIARKLGLEMAEVKDS